MQALSERTVVLRRAGAGEGLSTFANQVASAWPGPAWIIDAQSMEAHDEDAFRRVLLSAPRVARRDDWRVVPGRPRPLLILDGLPQAPTWLPPPGWPGAVLVLGDLPRGGRISRPPESAAKDFLRDRAATAGITWDDDALTEAVRLSGLAVDAVQLIGQEALTEALLTSRSRIDEALLLDGAVRAASRLPASHRALYQIGGARRALLLAMTRSPAASPTQWASHAGVPQKSATVHLARLVADGLLARPARGKYMVHSPLVRLHLQHVASAPVRHHRTASATTIS